MLVGGGVLWSADEPPDSRGQFIELDSEIQAIKAEILAINRDILLLEEASHNLHGQQLVVLVSVSENIPVVLTRIFLQLDGQSIVQHDYSASEAAALMEGGVHRLYTGRLSEGRHQLEVAISGRYSADKGFERQRSVSINKKPGRTFMELRLEPGEAEPDVNLREWQP